MGLGEFVPRPTWAQMAEFVEAELRTRFVEETLPKTEVLTWLDI
jgi:hypothetical protein